MTYTTGGGEQFYGGTWEKKQSPKSTTFTLLDNPFWPHRDDKVIKIRKNQSNRHAIRFHDDDTLTIYQNRDGTPCYFEPIE